jgi:hypothetical protein
METQRGVGMLGFHPYFDIWHNCGRRFFNSTHQLQFTTKEIRWYSFLLEAEWTLGLLNADRRIRSLENFEELHLP